MNRALFIVFFLTNISMAHINDIYKFDSLLIDEWFNESTLIHIENSEVDPNYKGMCRLIYMSESGYNKDDILELINNLDLDNSFVSTGVGYFYYQFGNIDRAMFYFSTAYSGNQSAINIWKDYFLANIYFNQGKYTEATIIVKTYFENKYDYYTMLFKDIYFANIIRYNYFENLKDSTIVHDFIAFVNMLPFLKENITLEDKNIVVKYDSILANIDFFDIKESSNKYLILNFINNYNYDNEDQDDLINYLTSRSEDPFMLACLVLALIKEKSYKEALEHAIPLLSVAPPHELVSSVITTYKKLQMKDLLNDLKVILMPYYINCWGDGSN